ncbi:MAG: RDD family protein [Betaproteobacteria bacterium]|nr:MAG: RDD family protein [Betaproteobacteria bacterium]
MSGSAEFATPSLARRLASLLYESLLLFAVGFAATWLFYFASGGRGAEGSARTLLQVFVVAVFAAYFLWCWLRGGQTLAMKAWRIRLVARDGSGLTPAIALARFVLALLLIVPLLGLGLLWALFDRERQFLHDRLAGTRLVLLPPRGAR